VLLTLGGRVTVVFAAEHVGGEGFPAQTAADQISGHSVLLQGAVVGVAPAGAAAVGGLLSPSPDSGDFFHRHDQLVVGVLRSVLHQYLLVSVLSGGGCDLSGCSRVRLNRFGGFEELIEREHANVLPHDFGPVHLFLIVVVCVNR